MAALKPTVTQTIPVAGQAQAQTYLNQMRATFRKYEEGTGLPLYKNAAGVVYRPTRDWKKLEVLANCVC